MQDKPITLPSFQELLQVIFGYQEKAEIPIQMAELLAVFDQDEEEIHIEFPNDTNNYKVPVVWRIRAWKESYKNYVAKKERSDLQRAVHILAKEKIEKLVKTLCWMTGLSRKDLLQRAITLVNLRKVKECAAYQVDLTDLLAADAKAKAAGCRIEPVIYLNYE